MLRLHSFFLCAQKRQFQVDQECKKTNEFIILSHVHV
jgi:hypothetical protein